MIHLDLDSSTAAGSNHKAVTVASARIQPDRMLSFIKKKLGRNSVLFDLFLFTCAEKLCPSYSGGMWDTFTLSNGGFFYQPPVADEVVLESTNGASHVMSREGAGIVISLFALNYLASKTMDDSVSILFYKLEDFALEHPEARKIINLVD